MKHGFLSNVVCAVVMATAAVFCSCTHKPTLSATDMKWSYGTKGLRPENVVQVMENIKASQPKSKQDLIKIIGSQPISSSSNYSFWEWQQSNAKGERYYSAFCGCLTEGNSIKYGLRWEETKRGRVSNKGNIGDKAVFDYKHNNAIKTAIAQSFRTKENSRAAATGRRCSINPAGLNSRLLNSGETLVSWHGIFANIRRPKGANTKHIFDSSSAILHSPARASW